MSATVLVTDYAWSDLDIERKILAESGASLLVAETGDEDELIELAPCADAILTCWQPVTEAVLSAARRCLTVARYGVGLDNIAVDTATELGMIVSNVPAFCTAEVADHTMALVLAHARRITKFAVATSAGQWDNRSQGPMRRLRGQTFGLVGYGGIAREVAIRARAFGYDVMAFSPSRAGTPEENGVRFTANLTELLRASDVVSLHLPLTANTRGIIGRAELSAMKPRAVLVSTARGALVDQDALIEALEQERLGGAALDVLDGEPPAEGNPLAAMQQVIVTPHAAFDSIEAIAELQETAARNVSIVLAGGVPGSIVNPAVLGSPAVRVKTRERASS